MVESDPTRPFPAELGVVEAAAPPVAADPEGPDAEALPDREPVAEADPDEPDPVAEAPLDRDWEVDPTDMVPALEPSTMTGADSTAKLAVLTPLEMVE
jgi:hypothetical protein